MTARDTRGLGSDRRPRSDWPYQKGRDPLGRIPTPPPDDPIEIMRGDWALGRLDRHPVKRLLDIRGGIGRGEVNDREDVGGIEALLSRTGHRDLKSTSGPTGLFGSPQENAIRGFQKDHGLRQDGIMRPGGETQTALAKVLAAAKKPATTFIPTFTPTRERRTAQVSENELRTQAKPVQPEQAREKPDAAPDGPAKQEARAESGQKEIPNAVKAAQKRMDRNLDLMKAAGFSRAEKHLKHYLEGTGQDVTYSRKEMRAIPQFAKGELVNNSRIEKSFTGEQKQDFEGKRRTYKKILADLKDGKEDTLESDYWESKYDKRVQLLSGDPDFALAFGDTSLKSEGKFKARREGNLIYIYGSVTHRLDDPYDFTKGQSGGDDALTVERDGGAKIYRMKAEWKQNVAGTVTIEDDKLNKPRLTNPRFDWTDVDPE